MTDLKFTSPSGETTIKVQDTGRLGTIAPKTQLHIRKTPMTEIEGEIKIHFEPEVIDDIYMRLGINKPKETYQQMLEQSLIREGYKMGYYESTHKNQMINKQEPPTIIEIGGVKYQRVEETGPKTLYQVFYDDKWSNDGCNQLCDTVEEWMSQYTCDYVACREYLNGYNACLETLRNNLR